MLSRQRRIWLVLAIGLVGVLGLVAAACGDGGDDGGDGDEADVEALLRQLYGAWNDKDVDGVLALITDNFIAENLEGATREQAPDILSEFIGEPPQNITELTNIEVSGDTATAEVAYTTGNVAILERDHLVLEDGVWKLDGFEQIPQEVPEGVTAVDVMTTEYRFTFDESAITDGNIAFNVSNIGGEQHVVNISKVPADLDIEQALQSEEEPEGIEEIGGIEPLDPGSDTTLIFTEALVPGRYVMLCFVEAADGEPHFLKGMWAEFTIE